MIFRILQWAKYWIIIISEKTKKYDEKKTKKQKNGKTKKTKYGKTKIKKTKKIKPEYQLLYEKEK